MSTEQTEIEIDGVRFRMRALRTSEARQLLARLGRVVGQGFVERAATSDVGKDAGGALVGMLLGAMRDGKFGDEQERFFEIIGKVSEMEVASGKWVPLDLKNQDAHFQRRLKLMYRWAWEALRYQYADFFGSAGLGLGDDGQG